MNRVLLAGLVAGLVSLPVAATLKQGDPAPDFTAQASLAGKNFTFSLKEALKTGPVVVYFYPSAYTNGCNIQAHTFAINQEKFAATGASVVGVSQDDIQRLNDFSADPEYCAGKVAVASDPEGKIAHAFDVAVREASPGKKDSRGVDIHHGFTERTTFVVTPDGQIAATLGGLKPAEHVERSLDIVRQLATVHH